MKPGAGLSATALRNDAPELPVPPEPKTPQDKWYNLDHLSARRESAWGLRFAGSSALETCGGASFPGDC